MTRANDKPPVHPYRAAGNTLATAIPGPCACGAGWGAAVHHGAR